MKDSEDQQEPFEDALELGDDAGNGLGVERNDDVAENVADRLNRLNRNRGTGDLSIAPIL